MRAVGGSDELQVAIDKFESKKVSNEPDSNLASKMKLAISYGYRYRFINGLGSSVVDRFDRIRTGKKTFEPAGQQPEPNWFNSTSFDEQNDNTSRLMEKLLRNGTPNNETVLQSGV
ncbi:hypothetical protein QVD17_16100 [Tagetes erecta]|uniref:Uncharacterized protein n=1 Tax=Tagetes erecta TaxID=13708 RepID=A0AAD8KQB8_TARER|nr:hypothetical protein QVD17_16100 [Tagetes erecta]